MSNYQMTNLPKKNTILPLKRQHSENATSFSYTFN